MKYLAWFDEIPDEKLTLSAGGKGASLCKLYRGELPVPNGFIVRAEMFDDFMTASNLRDRVLEKINGINFANYSDLVKKSQEIQEMIIQATMPDNFSSAIREYYLKLGDGLDIAKKENHPVAVRSSGTAEDLDDASFAGQMETFLYVMGSGDVARYVKECWASLYTDRALFYRKEKSFDEHGISIAVVVQRMVAADKAGVMFTVNPVTQERETCLIEGSWGLGEAVVSGLVTPDSYTVDKSGKLLDAFISEKETMVARKTGEPGVEETEVPEDKREMQVLNDRELKELVCLAVQLEAYFGKPQDVEWAIDGDNLYLLQSRPITTLS